MSHEWIEAGIALAIFLLGIGSGVAGWLVVRLVGSVDAVEEEHQEFAAGVSAEIRDVRENLRRMEVKLDLPPFHYTR